MTDDRKTAEEWAKAQLKRDLRNKHNQDIIKSIRGVKPTQGTAETDADPRNPNVR